MPLFEKTHTWHEKHLCSKVASGATVEEYKKFVRNAKFLCKQCGRTATNDENLCNPVPL